MLERLRSQIGTAGLIVAIVALVAALGGGAYAASDGHSDGKAVVSAKAKQGPRGKTGKTGPAGPAGSAGPAGPAGAKGDTGPGGANGTNGAAGANGKSVTATEIPIGEVECEERGGIMVHQEGVASGTEICNGEEGEEGSPWTAGGTLPQGATETGTWSYGVIPAAALPAVSTEPIRLPISFPIPLATTLDESHVHYINAANQEVLTEFIPATEVHKEVTSTVCLGTAAEPKAALGHLCIYTGKVNKAKTPFNGSIKRPVGNGITTGASPAGAILWIQELEEKSFGYGTWAVTAP